MSRIQQTVGGVMLIVVLMTTAIALQRVRDRVYRLGTRRSASTSVGSQSALSWGSVRSCDLMDSALQCYGGSSGASRGTAVSRAGA